MITDVADYFASGCGRCARFDTPDCAARQWAPALAALRDLCRAAGLLSDPAGVLERQGPNSRHPDMVRVTDAARVAVLAPAIRALLAQAMDHAAAGRRAAPRDADDMALPDALVAALDDDPTHAEAFQRLTPGRRRSHAIHVGGARTPAGQAARVARARGLILSGKGALDR